MKITRKQHTQDLSWFLDMEENGKLELNPPYQRRSVWGHKDRNFFLDTIFNNYPCPAIYLQKEITDTKIVYNVVDGKQRLQTILNFYKNKMRISKNFLDPKLAGKRWRDIAGDSELKYRFFNYSFSVEQLDCEGDAQWEEVFNRVNRNQKTLKDQELRHARFNGWFIKLAEEESEKPFWEDVKISTRGRSARMQNVEFISILMFVILEQDFVGFPQSNIDELYVKYDLDNIDEFPQEGDEVESIEDEENVENEIVYRSTIDKFISDFDKTKRIIEEIFAEDNELITYITKKTFTYFYTLWTYVAFNLEIDLDTPRIAKKYKKILEMCIKFKESGNSQENIKQSLSDDNPEEKLAYQFYINSIGASTEHGPRKSRHNAFIEFMEV